MTVPLLLSLRTSLCGLRPSAFSLQPYGTGQIWPKTAKSGQSGHATSPVALRTSSDRAQWLAIASGSANNIEGMADLSVTLSDPPTRAQVQEMLTKLNQLIDALQH